MLRVLAIILMIGLTFPGTTFARKSGIEKAGDIGQYLVPISALGYSLYKEDSEGISQLSISSAATLGAVYTLKLSINRKRPEHGDLSFPSGHTGSAFMGAAYLHRRYGLASSIPAYLAASFVGFSRVQAKKHYTGDVLAAAAIAITANYYLTDSYCISPLFEEDCVGISINKDL